MCKAYFVFPLSYLVIDFSRADKEITVPDEDVFTLSQRIIPENKEAYEVLAK